MLSAWPTGTSGSQGIKRGLLNVQRVVQDLQQHPELEVLQFESVLDTVRHLAKMTTSLKRRAEQGQFDALVVAELMPATAQPAPSLKMEPVVIDDDSSADSCKIQPTASSACHKKLPSQPDPIPVNLIDGQNQYGSQHSATSKTLPRDADLTNRMSDSDCLLADDEDELPPLHFPRARELDSTKSSSPGLIQSHCASDPKSKPDLSDTESVSRKINTPPPRGRVYLMKRTAVKTSVPGSPQSKLTTCTVTGVGNRQMGSKVGRKAVDEDQNKQAGSKESRQTVAGGQYGQTGCLSQADAKGFGLRDAACLPNEQSYHGEHNSSPKKPEYVSRMGRSPLSVEHTDVNPRKDFGSKREAGKPSVGKDQCGKRSLLKHMDSKYPHVIVDTDSLDGDMGTDHVHKTVGDFARGNLEVNDSCITFNQFHHKEAVGEENSACLAKLSHKNTAFDFLRTRTDFASNAKRSSKKTCTALYSSTEERGGGSDEEIPSLKCLPKIENSIPKGRGGQAESWDADRSDSDSLPDIDLPGPRVKGKQIHFDPFDASSITSTSKTYGVGNDPLSFKSCLGSEEADCDPLSSARSTLTTQRVKSDFPPVHSGLDSDHAENSSHGLGHRGYEPEAQKNELSAHEWTKNSGSSLGHLGSVFEVQKAGPSSSDADSQLADKIAQIAAVFPQLKSADILPVLQEYEGCVERCVIALLENPALLTGASKTDGAIASGSERNLNATDPIVLD